MLKALVRDCLLVILYYFMLPCVKVIYLEFIVYYWFVILKYILVEEILLMANEYLTDKTRVLLKMS